MSRERYEADTLNAAADLAEVLEGLHQGQHLTVDLCPVSGEVRVGGSAGMGACRKAEVALRRMMGADEWARQPVEQRSS